MFGTIGHARLVPGGREQFDALMADWQRDIRPLIPGPFVNLVGHAADDPEAIVFVALAQDQATYRALAERPEQDAWYRRLLAQIAGEVRWEDVAMEQVPDTGGTGV